VDTVKEWLRPELIWFLAGIGLLIAELAIPGLVIFFFGVGACLVATLCLIFDLSLNLQLLIFLLSSTILLISLRKWVGKIFMGRMSSKQEFNDIDADFIGRRAVVEVKITPDVPGKVEMNGTLWTATAGVSIPKGTPVQVIGKENLTLKVKSLHGERSKS
jgi:membrane protein implicated in regulation of membrane protease activity